MKLSIFQAALDQLHMEVYLKLYIFIQYVKVLEIGLLFLIITLVFSQFCLLLPFAYALWQITYHTTV